MGASGQWWFIRFIPTCVGNSCQAIIGHWLYTVHPHVCGELCVWDCEAGIIPGSSPRVWGTLSATSQNHHNLTVHPHVCGELIINVVPNHVLIGSSPRVWGTQNHMESYL